MRNLRFVGFIPLKTINSKLIKICVIAQFTKGFSIPTRQSPPQADKIDSNTYIVFGNILFTGK